MAGRERRVDRASRVARDDLARLGSEFRSARIGASLSQRQVGREAHVSGSMVSRIERGLAPAASIEQLARIGAVIGLDVRLRAYPGSDAIRDAGHARVIERLRSRLHPIVVVRMEVPLPIGGDRRAWDLWLRDLVDDQGGRRGMPAEVETRIHDVQAQLRRLALKMRDSGQSHVLLVVADTPANRTAVAGAASAFSGMFPVSARRALEALGNGRFPGGSSLIFV